MIASAAALGAAWTLPAPSLAAATTLSGVVAQPDGAGARIRIELSGPFQYLVTSYPDRVVIALDGVNSEEVSYHLTAGPVTAILIRPGRGHLAHVDVLALTGAPLEVVEQSLDGHTLVVRLAPRDAARRPTSPVSSAWPPPAPSVVPAPPSPSITPVPSVPPGASGSPSSLGSAAPSGSPVGQDGLLAGRRVISRALELETGTGRLLPIDGLVRVAVSDPEILGAVPVSSRELLVNARAAGRTTMYVWEGVRNLLVYTVEIAPAVDRISELRRLLQSLLPTAAIAVTEVTAPGPASVAPPGPAPYSPSTPGATLPGLENREQSAPPPAVPLLPGSPSPQPQAVSTPVLPVGGSGTGPALVLNGEVETQMDRQKAEDVARAYAPRIVNLLTVRRPVQVKLQVEVAELTRSALRTLGITWGGGQAVPGSFPSLNGGVYNLQVITSPGVGTNGLDLLVAQIQALAQSGSARLLAEPSLVVMAGKPASLLLGGQVPIPVAGANGSVTVEYKDFGVILNAQPDYQDDGRIFLQITPEVSTLDFADAIKVNGFNIPALRVRRAQTVVSLLPTQTLVLGGLLQHQDTEAIQKVPVLGDLPIIGPLFRSRTFQHDESDLVIFVTPATVEPGGAPAPHQGEEVRP